MKRLIRGLALLLAVCLGAGLCPAMAEGETPAYTDVAVLSTTDMHGKCWETNILTGAAVPQNMLRVSTAVREIRGLFGEASFSGSFFDKDFDHMYENGSYMIELGGMNDTGIEYIVYCVE